MSFTRWQSIVLGEVRFAPDRRAIARELQAHYEDHMEGLMDCGYAQKEAAAKALEALGDPWEIGRALNQVHKFWLGLLWKASQLLLLVLLLGLALTSGRKLYHWEGLPLIARTQAELAYEAPPAGTRSCAIPQGRAYLYLLEEGGKEEGEESLYYAELYLKGKGQVLSAAPPLSQGLSLADQHGPIPPFAHEDDLSPRRERYWTMEYIEFPGWTRQRYTITLHLPEPPEFLELSQTAGDGPWTLRAEKEGRP